MFRKPSKPGSCGGGGGGGGHSLVSPPSILPNVAQLQSDPGGCPGFLGTPVPLSLKSPGRWRWGAACGVALGTSPKLSMPSGVQKTPKGTWPVSGSSELRTSP